MKKILLIVIPIISFLMLAGAVLLIYTQVTAQEQATVEKVGPIVETEEFTVNVTQTTNRYIKAKFALEVTDEKVLTELEEKKPLLNDRIIMVLSSQTLDDLSTVEGKEEVKKALIKAINEFLDKGEVTKVYFISIIFS